MIQNDFDSHFCQLPSFLSYDGPGLLFEPVYEKTVHNLIVNSPVKSCCLHPIPASVAKQCVADLVPPMTKIVNYSHSTGKYLISFTLS